MPGLRPGVTASLQLRASRVCCTSVGGAANQGGQRGIRAFGFSTYTPAGIYCLSRTHVTHAMHMPSLRTLQVVNKFKLLSLKMANEPISHIMRSALDDLSVGMRGGRVCDPCVTHVRMYAWYASMGSKQLTTSGWLE